MSSNARTVVYGRGGAVNGDELVSSIGELRHFIESSRQLDPLIVQQLPEVFVELVAWSAAVVQAAEDCGLLELAQ